ncbi:hypothetical protein [Salinimicrobium terrae]|uniref:hypothetical protein n=1 Tax=Salinimicrobium terrae TaxID=470866 RepID=UPI00040190FC|nr:hypothetical protein [Salinimicrobium terrae]
MKTLIFYLVMLVLGTGHAQEFTELKEAKVEFIPVTSDVEGDGNRFYFKVKESAVGEFEKDPLAFMDTHFNINNLSSELKHEQYDSYEVSFVSRKGFLIADFNKRGNLLKTASRFKNIVLPEKLRHDLYRDHKGWKMTKNIHITNSRNGMVGKDIFKVILENGKDRKKLFYKLQSKKQKWPAIKEAKFLDQKPSDAVV